MKRMLMLMLGVFFVSVSVYANEISGEQAKKAVSFWVNSITNGASLISSRDVESVETATNETRNLFHLVKMKGGGTIITSADSRISPILAYSRNESLNVTNDNPLLRIVRHDMENRLSVIEKTESQPGMRMLSFSVTSRANNNATTSSDSEVRKSISESQNAWAAFLNEPSTTSSNRAKTLLSAALNPGEGSGGTIPNPGQGSGGIIPFYEDIKVLPLIKTTWNQSDKNSYSKYTPNNYPCGCVATAYAQLLRYHSYPVSRNFESVQLLCSVDGVSETLSTIGGVYEWDKMPYDVDGITEEQGSAIGKLCYDIGVLQGASFESDGTGMLMTSDLLTNYFGYANTRAAYGTFEGERLMSVISGNLDAGYPVMLSFRESSENIPGHCAIADGYGVLLTSAGSVTLTHLNMGWGGNDDNWYCLPTVLSYNIVDGILYNIFSEGAEDAIVNGRVLDSNGEPILCASVKISYQGKTHDVQVDSTGSWVKRVPSGVLISVVATYGENSVSKSISVDSSLGVSNNDIAFSNVTYTRRTLYVDALSGSDTNNGMSWSSAFKSLSCAVDQAQTGDMVIVAPGTYTAINSKGKAIEIRSVDGAENTIITGEGVQRGAILGVKNGDVKTVLNGFTICDGISPNGPSAYRYNGGGVLFGTLKNCIVKNCEALECGGGVYGSILENCHVVSNSAKYGGGVADSVIRKCRISSNNATVSGGAGFWTDDCCFRLENSCYAGNYVLIGNSVIYDNTSKDGITVCGTERYYVSPKDFKICTIPQVVNCTISGIVKLMSICNSVAKIDENLTYGSWFAVGYNMLYDENMFKDASKGDFRISSEGFKLVNAGNTARAKEMPGADDFLGNDRFIGAAVDIGAIEYQSEKDWHVEYIMDGVSLSYCGRNTNIIFPSEFDGLPVRKVGINNDAARECVRSVIIPNGVKEISPEAFSGSQIQNIKIPDSVTSIGDYAFYRCSGLTSVTIPNGVTSIGDDAFAYCSGLTSITIPNSVTSIGEDVFLGCDSLTSTSVPEYVLDKGVRSIFGIKKHVGFLPDIAITHVVINDGVTNIGNEAFYGCYSLISITIPNSVTNIGVKAFYSCDSLTSVTIPNSVTSIGFASFADCSGLTSVTIPDSVSSIGALAFNGCTSLESVHITDIKNWIAINFGDVKSNPLNINEKKANLYLNGQLFVFEELILPDTVTRIGDYAFYDCDWLTSVTIPDSVTSIGNYAFIGCNGLTSVTIPNSVTSIGEEAFYNCSGLASVTIGNSVTNIGYAAFRGCSSLASVTIPDSVTNIGYAAFEGCSSLASVTIPDSVTSIGDYAFDGCRGLTSVTIGNSVTSIGEEAFYNCSGLASVTIPDSVTSIGSYAFYGCTSLTSLVLPNNDVVDIGDSVFDKCASLNWVELGKSSLDASLNNFLGSSVSNIATIVIRSGVTSIPEFSFYGCISLTQFVVEAENKYFADRSGLLCSKDGTLVVSCPRAQKEVIFPYNVTSIGDYAFYGCRGLTSVTIPDSVTSIGTEAFRGCSSLTSVTIPDGVTSIGSSAFHGCSSLASVTIPDSVTSIGSYAFYGCYSLRNITIPQSVCNSDRQISDIFEHDRITNIVILDGVERIAPRLFENCSSLASIYIPDSVIYIGYQAFRGCDSLLDDNGLMIVDDVLYFCEESVEHAIVPQGVKSIASAAFYGCWSITSVTIPDSVTSIGTEAFRGCSSLTSVTIPDGVTSIGRSAFRGCSSLTSVTIPDGVTSIGRSAFYGCSSLTSVTIPDGVTSIGTETFRGCSSLTSVTIPDGVTSIGRSAFYDCDALKEVSLGCGVTNIGEKAFGGYWYPVSIFIDDLTKWCNINISGDLCDRYLNLYIGGKLLTDLVVPDDVTQIGKYAFNLCNIGSVQFHNGITNIEEMAFTGVKSVALPFSVCEERYGISKIFNRDVYSSITNITILDGVEKIAESCFSGCSSLKSVEIPDSVTNIESLAFNKCKSLTSIEIPESVAHIGRGAFQDCTSLKNVVIPQYACTDKFSDIFLYNSFGVYGILNITNIVVLNGVTNIGNSAFSGLGSSLLRVSVPDSVTSIGESAFYKCSSLKDIELPEGLTNVGKDAFYGCTGLFSDGYFMLNSILYSYIGAAADITIPNGVTKVADYAVYGRKTLKSVTVPSAVEYLGRYAFAENTALTNITFLGDAPSVEATTFNNLTANCTVYVSLFSSGWDVDIPGIWNGLSIRHFNHAVTFDLGEHGVRVGGGELKQIVDNGSAAVEPTIEVEDGWVFAGWSASLFNITKSLTIKAVYKRKPVVIDGVALTYDIVNDAVTIGNGTESAVANTTTGILKIPSSINGYPVRSIGANAFRGCSGLTGITIPDSVTSVGTGAFSGCRNLTRIVLPYGIRIVPSSTFNGCDLLEEVVMPESIIRILGNAFANCRNLKNINLPSNLTSIGDLCFSGCTKLDRIEIPASVIEIGSLAFDKCTSLTNVTFMGNAPAIIKGSPFVSIHPALTVWVSRLSSGWNVDIPGIWKGAPIRYSNHYVTFLLGDLGVRTGGGELSQLVNDGEHAVLPEVQAVEGWIFEGWIFDGWKWDASTPVTDNMEFVAVYVTPVVSINGREFGTIHKALDFAIDGQTIKLLTDVDLEMPIEIFDDKDVTIDLNGRKLLMTNGHNVCINMECGNLTIDDSVGGGCVVGDVVSVGGFIWLKNGRYEGLVHAADSMGGGMLVTGGMFKYPVEEWYLGDGLMCAPTDDDMFVIKERQVHKATFDIGEHGRHIGGGELVQEIEYGDIAEIPVIEAEKGWIFTGWLPDATGPLLQDTTFVAQYEPTMCSINGREFGTIYKALNFVMDGQTIKLLTDIDLEMPIQIFYGRNVTIDLNGRKLLMTNGEDICIYNVRGDLTIDDSVGGGCVVGDVVSGGGFIWLKNGRYEGYIYTHDSMDGGMLVTGGIFKYPVEEWYLGDGLMCVPTDDDMFVIKERPVCRDVIFDIGEHGRHIGGGELFQVVEDGGIAEIPEVEAENGWEFVGWSPDVTKPISHHVVFVAQYVELPPSREFEIDAVEWVKPLTVTIGEKIRFNYDLGEIDASNWGMCEGASYCAIVCDSDGNVLSELKYDIVPNVGYFDWTVSADCPEHCLVGVIPVELWRELEVNPIEIINGFDVTVQRNDLEEDESDIEIEKILITDGFITNQSVVLRMGIDLKNKELAIKCRDFLLKSGSVYSEYAMSSDLTKWIANDSTLVDNVTIEAGKIYLTMTVSFQELSLAQLKRQLRLIRGVVKINGVPITTSNTVRVDYSSNTVVVNNPIETYTVTFVLGIGTRIGGGELVQTVEAGNSAIEPMIADGPFDGWCFTGWDRDDWQCVNEDITVNAVYEDVQYVPIRHFVLFDIGIHGNHINGPLEQYVLDGGYATVPEIEAHEGWTFAGWSRNVDEPICGATTFVALYEQINTALPVLGDDATSADVKLVLEGAIDENLSNIVDVVTYNSFRMWADKVKNSTGTSAGASGVKVSPNAWLSFALDTDALITAAPKEGDLTIGGFTQGSLAGVVDLSVSISGIAVGDNATAANLEKVFGVEGAGSLDEGEFKEENVDIEFDNPEGGKVKIKATPKNSAAKQFFFRVKMK